MPDWLLYEKWQLIRRSEYELVNAQSSVIAQFLSTFRYYIAAKGSEHPESVEMIDPSKFLPLQPIKEGRMDSETAKIVWEAIKHKDVPDHIQRAIAQVMPDNWQLILSQEQSNG